MTLDAQLGQCLQPCRHDDAVAENIPFVVDDVADIDADARACPHRPRPSVDDILVFCRILRICRPEVLISETRKNRYGDYSPV
jgi:hypothetical protein